jgi:hypothetical protein
MAKANKLKGTFELMQRGQKQFIIKIVLVVLLIVTAIILAYSNGQLLQDNKKMIKFINNEEVFKQNLKGLQESEAGIAKNILIIPKDADLEKIKGEYINRLMQMVQRSDLKVDSYRSEIEKKDGFVVFKYNVTIVGDFVQALHFFSLLGNEATNAYVSRYDFQLHQEKMIRLGLTVEVLGAEG